MKIISFVNNKGGVGKTTSTINVGAALSNMGYRVLLIDFDHQCNLTVSLGIPMSENETIADCLLNPNIKLPIRSYSQNLDVIPTHLKLNQVEMQLYSLPGNDFFLREILEKIEKNRYDFVLIDCAPALNKLTMNALTASTDVIIPVESEYLALNGLEVINFFISTIKKRTNPNLNITGILMTMFDIRNNLSKEVSELVEKKYNEILLPTKIRKNIALAEAPARHQHIFDYNPECNGADDYKNATNDILKKLK